MDPTSACNLHCTGCWAAEYGNKLNLSYEELDSIVRQAKELGCYFFLFTGGEPLMRKKDIIRLCEEHSDCQFTAFTNATLIDGAFEESTDFRRGEGTFRRIEKAMAMLREKRLPFGVSCCYTSRSVEVHGLHHVVVYAGLEAPLLCGKVVPRCHEEDGDILIQLPDGAREINAARGVPGGVFVFNSALAALRACSRCRAA